MEEDKKLLSADLSARLPFNIKCQFTLKYGDNGHKEGTYLATITTFDGKDWLEVEYNDTNGANGKLWLRDWSCSLDDIKPYLRPLSSMTEDENNDLYKSGGRACWINSSEIRVDEYAGFKETYRSLIWLVRNHFDCFNLINQSLAIKVTKNNNPYKQNEKDNCE